MPRKKSSHAPRVRWEHYRCESFLVPVGDDKVSIASYREIGPATVLAIVDGRESKTFRRAIAARRWIEGIIKRKDAKHKTTKHKKRRRG